MTLKSYLLLSGGGLVATYLVTSQPVVPPGRATMPRPPATRAAAPVDIQEQAARLETRTRADVDFNAPSRNPFRFAATRPAAAALPSRELNEEPQPLVEDVPPPPPIRLAGVGAADDGRRTAYLVTIQGLLTVHEGETVPPDYRVQRIEEGAIELVAGDGSIRRLQLRP